MPVSTKRKAPVKLAAPLVKSQINLPVKHTIDQSQTTVSGPGTVRPPTAEPISISSDEDSVEEDDDEDISDADNDRQQEEQQEEDVVGVQGLVNGNRKSDLVLQGQPRDDEDGENDDDDELNLPSFGELLGEADGNEVIDVSALLQPSSTTGALVPLGQTTVGRISNQSLTSVLTQALRTDDTKMLESCLHSADDISIRNTIEGLDSALAGILLDSLAARLHRRPGRAGILMSWVQWTLVAHGGALASQPKVMLSLRNLQSVLAERAKGLNSLLVLKGKLDLLNFQMELRKKRKASSRPLRGALEEEDEEDQHVIYVEGEEKRADKKKALMNGHGRRNKRSNTHQGDDDEDDMSSLLDEAVVDSDDDDDDDDEEEDEEEDDDDDVSEEGNVHDTQLHQKPQEEEEEEVEEEDVDESMGEKDEDGESDEEDAAPPSKMQKTAARISRKRR